MREPLAAAPATEHSERVGEEAEFLRKSDLSTYALEVLSAREPTHTTCLLLSDALLCACMGTHILDGGSVRMTTQRLNLAIESELYRTLKLIAAHKNTSVTKLINYRLNQSLTFEERFGQKPEWLIKMEEAGLAPDSDSFFSDVLAPLPESLRRYQDEINHLDSVINLLEKRKEVVQMAFNDEVSRM